MEITVCEEFQSRLEACLTFLPQDHLLLCELQATKEITEQTEYTD